MENIKTGIIEVVIVLIIGFCIVCLFNVIRLIPHTPECKYKIPSVSSGCVSKEQYCRFETRKMFVDLNDTWGSDTNNADTISKSMLEVYNKCIEME